MTVPVNDSFWTETILKSVWSGMNFNGEMIQSLEETDAAHNLEKAENLTNN